MATSNANPILHHLDGRDPAFIDWKTFERIQTMLRDNGAEYLVDKTRGIPRDGAALLHGIAGVANAGTNHRALQGRQPIRMRPSAPATRRSGLPVFAIRRDRRQCGGRVPGGGAPAEIDAWARARKAQRHADETLQRAEMQQIERLRYEARLAERQFNRVDPDNRLVAAELERRWETALCALVAPKRPSRGAQARSRPRPIGSIHACGPRLSPLASASRTVGRSSVSREHRKALLRCLIDKVVRGPVAKFFRARFVRELRSAEPVSTQLSIEFWPSESPAHNQKLGHAAFSRSSHTGRKNFATGPPPSGPALPGRLLPPGVG